MSKGSMMMACTGGSQPGPGSMTGGSFDAGWDRVSIDAGEETIGWVSDCPEPTLIGVSGAMKPGRLVWIV